jgi:RHS repeat-associated protein
VGDAAVAVLVGVAVPVGVVVMVGVAVPVGVPVTVGVAVAVAVSVGVAVAVSVGNYRGAAPTQTVTDRDFTGQPQNREVGLLYYQARFYVPSIGRFASADTLVPDHKNPQQLTVTPMP